MNSLLTVDELAALLKVPRSTIYAWRYRGCGPPAIKVGRYLRFKPEEVEAWLSAQATASPDLGRVSPLTASGDRK